MDESTFINQWLNKMFKDAERIHKSRENYYKRLKLPYYLQNTYLNYYRTRKNNKTEEKKDEDEDEYDKEEEDEEENKQEGGELVIKSEVLVIGYNSKTFDVNIFIRKIKDPNIEILNVIGSLSQYKALTILHKNFHLFLNSSILKHSYLQDLLMTMLEYS
jgi:hypothetical protein